MATFDAPSDLAPDAAGSDTGPARSTVRTADGIELAQYRWCPGEARFPPKATVALAHGLAEHAGRYAPLAARLGEAGIELVAVDLRGHGHSPGPRVWAGSIDEYLRDFEALLGAAARPPIPFFLMGHSMGGTIAALYAAERLTHGAAHGQRPAGLILSSPALAAGRDVPRWMIAASQLVSRVWPRYPAMKIDPALLARDSAVVEANRNDPLVHHGPIPARTGAEILVAMKRIERARAALDLPVLIFHGSDDKLTEPEGSREFAHEVGSADCTLTIFEGSYHETMNDLDRTRVIDALIEWIGAHSE
jgi:alpha-beta hydrolase superfamily lysophospholipase